MCQSKSCCCSASSGAGTFGNILAALAIAAIVSAAAGVIEHVILAAVLAAFGFGLVATGYAVWRVWKLTRPAPAPRAAEPVMAPQAARALPPAPRKAIEAAAASPAPGGLRLAPAQSRRSTQSR